MSDHWGQTLGGIKKRKLSAKDRQQGHSGEEAANDQGGVRVGGRGGYCSRLAVHRRGGGVDLQTRGSELFPARKLEKAWKVWTGC